MESKDLCLVATESCSCTRHATGAFVSSIHRKESRQSLTDLNRIERPQVEENMTVYDDIEPGVSTMAPAGP